MGWLFIWMGTVDEYYDQEGGRCISMHWPSNEAMYYLCHFLSFLVSLFSHSLFLAVFFSFISGYSYLGLYGLISHWPFSRTWLLTLPSTVVYSVGGVREALDWLG